MPARLSKFFQGPYSAVIYKPNPPTDYWESYLNVGRRFKRLCGGADGQEVTQKTVDEVTVGSILLKDPLLISRPVVWKNDVDLLGESQAKTKVTATATMDRMFDLRGITEPTIFTFENLYLDGDGKAGILLDFTHTVDTWAKVLVARGTLKRAVTSLIKADYMDGLQIKDRCWLWGASEDGNTLVTDYGLDTGYHGGKIWLEDSILCSFKEANIYHHSRDLHIEGCNLVSTRAPNLGYIYLAKGDYFKPFLEMVCCIVENPTLEAPKAPAINAAASPNQPNIIEVLAGEYKITSNAYPIIGGGNVDVLNIFGSTLLQQGAYGYTVDVNVDDFMCINSILNKPPNSAKFTRWMYHLAGMGFRWHSNIGVGGTATIAAGSTYVDVTHGLGITPDLNRMIVMPRDNLAGRSFWTSAATSTTFRINMSSADAGAAHNFGWGYH